MIIFQEEGSSPKFWRNPARAKSQHQRPFPVKGGTRCQKGSPRMKREGEPWICTTRIKPSTTASGWHTAKASTLQKTRGKQRRSTTSQATSNLGIFHWSQGHVNMTRAKHAVRTTTGKATCWVKPQVKLGTHYLSLVHLFSTVFTLELLWWIVFVLYEPGATKVPPKVLWKANTHSWSTSKARQVKMGN